MTCKLKQRQDDIPKYKGEKSWVCDACPCVIIAKTKPRCRKAVKAEMEARRAAADAELFDLKRKP